MGLNSSKGRKHIVTVDINKETYQQLKVEAQNKHYNTKEYINEILEMILVKRDYLDTIAPNLTVVGSQENGISLLDSYKKEVYEVFMKDSRLWCEKDNTSDCIHTFYVCAIPELGRLVNPKRMRNGKNEGLVQQPQQQERKEKLPGPRVILSSNILIIFLFKSLNFVHEGIPLI